MLQLQRCGGTLLGPHLICKVDVLDAILLQEWDDLFLQLLATFKEQLQAPLCTGTVHQGLSNPLQG